MYDVLRINLRYVSEAAHARGALVATGDRQRGRPPGASQTRKRRVGTVVSLLRPPPAERHNEGDGHCQAASPLEGPTPAGVAEHHQSGAPAAPDAHVWTPGSAQSELLRLLPAQRDARGPQRVLPRHGEDAFRGTQQTARALAGSAEPLTAARRALAPLQQQPPGQNITSGQLPTRLEVSTLATFGRVAFTCAC
jgi:hypothetical protein